MKLRFAAICLLVGVAMSTGCATSPPAPVALGGADLRTVRLEEQLASIARDAAPGESRMLAEGVLRESRALAVEYLKSGEEAVRWRGLSSCRVCGWRENGSRCLVDDTYVWPEGFAHYVEAHGLRPPDEFVQHMLKASADG